MGDPQRGQGTVEYALIVGLVTIFVISIMVALGPVYRDFMGEQMSKESLDEHQSALSSGVYD